MEDIKLLNEDCLDFMRNNIPDNSIDLVVTDPPYPTTRRGCYGSTGGMLRAKLSMEGKIFKYNNTKPCTYIPELYRILKDRSHCYIMTNHINLYEILTEAKKVGFTL